MDRDEDELPQYTNAVVDGDSLKDGNDDSSDNVTLDFDLSSLGSILDSDDEDDETTTDYLDDLLSSDNLDDVYGEDDIDD